MTLIYGENNSGKSALVRLPALLADSLNSKGPSLNANSEIVGESSLRDLQCKVAIPSSESPDTEIRLELTNGVAFDWTLQWGDLSKRLEVDSLKVTEGGGVGEEFSSAGMEGMLPSTVGIIPEAHLAIRRLWGKTLWLGTNRVGPSTAGISVGRVGRIWGNGEMAEANVLSSRPLLKRVAAFYKKHFQCSLSSWPLGDGQRERLLLEPLNGAHASTFGESGTGLSYVFPVLVAAESIREKGGVLIVEEPEAHLHPKIQQALAEHFVEILKDNKNTQIIAETHSELFLVAMMNAFLPRSGFDLTDDLQIYWTERSRNGAATVEHIKLDELGRPLTPRLEQAFETMGVMRRELLKGRKIAGRTS